MGNMGQVSSNITIKWGHKVQTLSNMNMKRSTKVNFFGEYSYERDTIQVSSGITIKFGNKIQISSNTTIKWSIKIRTLGNIGIKSIALKTNP